MQKNENIHGKTLREVGEEMLQKLESVGIRRNPLLFFSFEISSVNL
jgi:hypothetical protein